MCCASHPFLSFNFIFFFNKHFLSICFCFSFFYLSSISPTQWVKSSCLERFSGFFKNRTFWKVLAGSGGGSWGWETYQVNWQRDSRYTIHLQNKTKKLSLKIPWRINVVTKVMLPTWQCERNLHLCCLFLLLSREYRTIWG